MSCLWLSGGPYGVGTSMRFDFFCGRQFPHTVRRNLKAPLKSLPSFIIKRKCGPVLPGVGKTNLRIGGWANLASLHKLANLWQHNLQNSECLPHKHVFRHPVGTPETQLTVYEQLKRIYSVCPLQELHLLENVVVFALHKLLWKYCKISSSYSSFKILSMLGHYL